MVEKMFKQSEQHEQTHDAMKVHMFWKLLVMFLKLQVALAWTTLVADYGEECSEDYGRRWMWVWKADSRKTSWYTIVLVKVREVKAWTMAMGIEKNCFSGHFQGSMDMI